MIPTVGGIAVKTFQCSTGYEPDHKTCPLGLEGGCSCICHDKVRQAAARERERGLTFVRKLTWDLEKKLGLDPKYRKAG